MAEICTENIAIRFQKTPESSRSYSPNQISVEAPTCHPLSVASATPVVCADFVACEEPIAFEEPVVCEEPFPYKELNIFEMSFPGEKSSLSEESVGDIFTSRKSKGKRKVARKMKEEGKAKNDLDWGYCLDPLPEAMSAENVSLPIDDGSYSKDDIYDYEIAKERNWEEQASKQIQSERQVEIQAGVVSNAEPKSLSGSKPENPNSNICSLRVEHLLNGDAWKDCSECRAMLREISLRMFDED